MLCTLGKLSLEGAHFTRLKPLILLTYLSLEGTQSRKHLSKLFWPEAKDPFGDLSVALSRLRKAHPGSIQSDLYSVESSISVDALEFSRAVGQGNYKAALDLYKGPFLASVALPDWSTALESWVYDTRETLAAEAQTCLLKLAERYADNGRSELAAQYAETAYTLSAAPALEPETLALIFRLLEEGGHEATKAVAAEAEELGFTLVKSDSSKTSKVDKTTPHNLPAPNSSFIGRQDELTTLNLQLSDPNCRLLTLMGPGGIGKSRLALSLAYAQLTLNLFEDGVYLVALESLQSADLVPTRIAEALELSLKGQEPPLNLVTSFVGKKKILLILDNIEHLPESTSTLSTLLKSCPNLKVLVTSRARLHSKDEWVFQLGGLSYPPQSAEGENPFDYDAPKLFAERAKQSRLDLTFTSDDYQAMARLCDFIGGLPLALEFAAAWLSAMSLAEVVEEVERSLEILHTTHRDDGGRHQSMAGVFAQSWQRLSVENQAALRKLSVFEGGFTRDAAKEVAGVGLEQLMNLISTSFVTLEKSGRYGFHPLTKQYLKQQLYEDTEDYQEVKNRHRMYFLSLVEKAELKLESEEQATWLDRIACAMDDIRAALDWSISRSEAATALRLAGALHVFWDVRGHFTEGSNWLVRALKLSYKADKKSSVKAMYVAGSLAQRQGQLKNARTYFEAGLVLGRDVGDQKLIAELLLGLGSANEALGNHSDAQTHYEEGLAMSKHLGNWSLVAKLLNNLGSLENTRGNYTLARTLHKESLLLARKLGNQVGVAKSLYNLGVVNDNDGDSLTACSCFKETLKISERLGSLYGIAISLNSIGVLEERKGNLVTAANCYKRCLTISENISNWYCAALTLTNLGEVAIKQEDYTTAHDYLEKSLRISSELGMKRMIILALESLANLACSSKQFAQAVRGWGSVERLRQEVEVPLAAHKRQAYERKVSLARETLDNETFKAAWEAGRKMTLEEAVAYALN